MIGTCQILYGNEIIIQVNSQLQVSCIRAEGMYRKPYHLCPPKNPERCGPGSDPNNKIWMNQNSMIGTKLLDFFTTFPWVDWAESVPFLRSSTHREGDEEVSISKPSLDYTYNNVFALRKHKLEMMKQIIDAVPQNVKLVRLKEIERSPEKFIQVSMLFFFDLYSE